jgi:hypothetical protein
VAKHRLYIAEVLDVGRIRIIPDFLINRFQDRIIRLDCVGLGGGLGGG